MLNQPYTDQDSLEDTISWNIQELIRGLQKEKLTVTLKDIHYNFFDRVEYLYIDSEQFYPDEDLPANFGVQRGYSGGGMHGSLQRTQIDRMTKRRQAKAERILALLQATFWQILRDVDKISQQNYEEEGESFEDWDTVSI